MATSGSGGPSELVRWMGLRLRVPRDWEIVRHTRNPARGSLVFVDRRKERLELHWQICKSEPDLERMLDNQRSQWSTCSPAPAVLQVSGLLPFRGVRAVFEHGVTTRLVRFDAKSSRLLELVVVGASIEESSELCAWLCRHVAFEASADSAERWSAFGVDVTVTSGARLAEVLVRPADVTLGFELGEGRWRERAEVRRLGLFRSWFDGDLVALAKRHAVGVAYGEFTEVPFQGGSALCAEGLEPAPVLHRLFGRQRRRRVWLWVSEGENALYQVTASGYAKRSDPPLELTLHPAPRDHDQGQGEV